PATVRQTGGTVPARTAAARQWGNAGRNRRAGDGVAGTVASLVVSHESKRLTSARCRSSSVSHATRREKVRQRKSGLPDRPRDRREPCVRPAQHAGSYYGVWYNRIGILSRL